MSNSLTNTETIKHLAQLIGTAPSVVPDLNLIGQVQQITTNPEKSSEIPIVTDIGDVQTAAPYDYDKSDVIIDNLPAEPTKFLLSFSVEPATLQAIGLTVRQLINSAVAKFEASIWDTVIAPLLTVENFNTAAGVAAVSFNGSDFDTLLCSTVAKERVVVLDTDYAVKVKPTWLPATGAARVLECSRWTAAGDDVKGFVSGDRRGIVTQVGLPVLTPNQANSVSREVVTLPGLGIQTELTTWHMSPTKSDHCNLIAYVSAAVCDASALKLLKSL